MVIFYSFPAKHIRLFEVDDSSIDRFTYGDAPLFARFQVNEPYFFISSLLHHNLLLTDHIHGNLPNVFTFESLSK